MVTSGLMKCTDVSEEPPVFHRHGRQVTQCNLIIQAGSFSETSVLYVPTTECHIPEEQIVLLGKKVRMLKGNFRVRKFLLENF